MADVAHELRTPLAILQGRIEGLLDGVYPRDESHLAELLEETRHLSRLVEDLGILANAEAGALELPVVSYIHSFQARRPRAHSDRRNKMATASPVRYIKSKVAAPAA